MEQFSSKPVIDLLFLIADAYTYLISLALLAGLFVFKRLNSFTGTLTILVVFSVVMNEIKEPLYNLALSSQYKYVLWYGTYALLDGVIVGLVYWLHSKMEIQLSAFSRNISELTCILLLLQELGYFDALYIDSDVIVVTYPLMKNLIPIRKEFSHEQKF